MTLDEKRQVIEILMCASDYRTSGLALVAFDLGLGTKLGLKAVRLRKACKQDDDSDDYEATCVEAAYRLIESHPALSAEWFT